MDFPIGVHLNIECPEEKTVSKIVKLIDELPLSVSANHKVDRLDVRPAVFDPDVFLMAPQNGNVEYSNFENLNPKLYIATLGIVNFKKKREDEDDMVTGFGVKYIKDSRTGLYLRTTPFVQTGS